LSSETTSPETVPARRDLLSDRLYDAGFFLIEAFAALEVTAVIVASARIAGNLGIREEMSSMIINSYLYPLFAVMVVALVLSRWISRTVPPVPFFLSGLVLFSAGNVACFLSQTPAAFFAGRFVMGVGGAVAFAGQLWTLADFHRWRITRPLVWGEVGAAIGVVAGPLVGGFFAQHAPGGWRDFFLVNAGLGLITAVFAVLGLRGRVAEHLAGTTPRGEASPGRRTTIVMTAWQVAVSALIVGAEYLFSDYLQHKAGKSPMFVGGMTALASVGAIAGSLWAARLESRLHQLPPLAAAGLFASLGALAVCLDSGSYLLSGIPIFAAGLGMGLASVSIYACIVKESAPYQFLTRSMIYLLGMQSGNALGVQAVGIAEMLHLGVVATAAALAAVPLLVTAGIAAYVWSGRGDGPGVEPAAR
jgi:MFS family permease